MSTDGHNSDMPDVNRWAAYVLGRHLVMVGAWQEILWNAASLDRPHPWVCGPWPDLGTPPWELGEFDTALRELVIARCADPGVLVELHRSWDRLAGACVEMAEMVRVEDSQEVGELYWGSLDARNHSRLLAESLLIPGANELREWYHFGIDTGQVLLGEVNPESDAHFPTKDWSSLISHACMDLISEWDHLSALEQQMRQINDRCAQAGQLSQGRDLDQLAAEVKQILEDGGNLGEYLRVGQEWRSGVTDFDSRLRQRLSTSEAPEPLLIVDEAREVLTFLGCEFPFDDFKSAAGGLKCYSVLAQSPRTVIMGDAMIQRAGIAADEGQLDSYLSRFRRVLKRAVELYCSRHGGRLPQDAAAAFIVLKSDRYTKQRRYCLALDPRLVRYIGKSS